MITPLFGARDGRDYTGDLRWGQVYFLKSEYRRKKLGRMQRLAVRHILKESNGIPAKMQEVDRMSVEDDANHVGRIRKTAAVTEI